MDNDPAEVYTKLTLGIIQPTNETKNTDRIFKHSSMFQYNPSLNIDYLGQPVRRLVDTTNPIFGFQTVRGEIIEESDNSNQHYSKHILRKDSVTSVPITVFGNTWPQPQFETFDEEGEWFGYKREKWNLSINLRKLDPNPSDTLNSDVILTIYISYNANHRVANGIIDTVKYDNIKFKNLSLHSII